MVNFYVSIIIRESQKETPTFTVNDVTELWKDGVKAELIARGYEHLAE